MHFTMGGWIKSHENQNKRKFDKVLSETVVLDSNCDGNDSLNNCNSCRDKDKADMSVHEHLRVIELQWPKPYSHRVQLVVSENYEGYYVPQSVDTSDEWLCIYRRNHS